MQALRSFIIYLRSPFSWLSLGTALAVAAPIGALLYLSILPGGDDAMAHLWTTVLPRYALHSLLLVTAVSIGVLLIGVGAAWLIAAYQFPGRTMLEVAMILPLAMPAFVMAYAYTDFLDVSGPVQTALRAATGWAIGDYYFPSIRSWPGAAVLLALALYPYVYMLARNAFAERSASLSEAARSLGLRGPQIWLRVIYPVARPAVVAGLALVIMETLADFGTVSFFAIDTFSSGIYRAWQGLGDRNTAARLALILLATIVVLLWVERWQRGRMAFHARAPRPAPPRPLSGSAAALAGLACALPVLFGFILPTLLLLRAWWTGNATLDTSRLLQWSGHTALLSALAVAVIVPLALSLSYAARTLRSFWMRAVLMCAGLGYAVPGIVLGFGLLIVLGAIDRTLGQLGAPGLVFVGSSFAVVYAYCVRFLAIAQQGLDASLKRISPAMDASARTLGANPLDVLRRVHWPLLRPSLATAALLVLVDCLKELPATLVLRPFNFDTLAVMAYHLAADERLAEAAAPSLVIVLVGLVPVTILARSFRR